MKIFRSAVVFTILVIGFVFSAYSQDETRASKTWEVQKYDLTATLPTTESDRFLGGRAVLTLRNVGGSPSSQVTLRISDKAEVAEVKVNGTSSPFSKREEKIDASRNLQRSIVRLPSIPPNQIVTVEVNYKLKVEENSGLNALSPAGSQFLPLSFWYPTPNSWYFARGADYAPFRLQVIAPGGQTVISAGAGSENTFEQSLNGQPFFLTGSWDAQTSAGVTIHLSKGMGTEEQKRAQELAALVSDAKVFMEKLFGPAPNVPLRIVSVRRGAGFSSGGVILVDESIFRRAKIDALTAMTAAEAVAKLWLGTAVQVTGDGGGVIREGLSRFAATEFIEEKFGKEIADIERLRQRTAYAAVVRRDAPLNMVSPLEDFYFPATANKGAMVWRLLAKRIGADAFFEIVRANLKNGNIDLSKLRGAFSAQKDLLDYAFDQVTDMNLLVGLPQPAGAETRVALRNTGSVDATVEVVATTEQGPKLRSTTTVAAKSFGEVIFKTSAKIVRTEIDVEKLFPQTDYSDDVAPREFNENDLLLVIKRDFDRQDFVNAEKSARIVLREHPRFDDARTLFARVLLAEGKTTEAEKEFRAVLEEKLPSARSLAWANVGLGEISLRNGQPAPASKFFEEAIRADAEYGATLAARQGKLRANVPATTDESIRAFFAQFDKAAVSGRKADLDALILTGEIPRFAGGIAGQAQEWTTRVLQVEQINASNAIVETSLRVKILNRNPESGTAVFRLTQVGNAWRLSGVEIFEVR